MKLYCKDFRESGVAYEDIDCCEYCHEGGGLETCEEVELSREIDSELVEVCACCQTLREIEEATNEDWKKTIELKRKKICQ